MADGAVVALAALVAIRENLRPLLLREDFAGHGDALRVAADLDAGAFAGEEHFTESDGRTDFALEFFDGERVALGDPVLLSTGFDDCVGHGCWFLKNGRGNWHHRPALARDKSCFGA